MDSDDVDKIVHSDLITHTSAGQESALISSRLVSLSPSPCKSWSKSSLLIGAKLNALSQMKKMCFAASQSAPAVTISTFSLLDASLVCSFSRPFCAPFLQATRQRKKLRRLLEILIGACCDEATTKSDSRGSPEKTHTHKAVGVIARPTRLWTCQTSAIVEVAPLKSRQL